MSIPVLYLFFFNVFSDAKLHRKDQLFVVNEVRIFSEICFLASSLLMSLGL